MVTGPVLFRAIEAWSPTLLIDEADSFVKLNDELRGILNSGHARDLAFVIRTVGEDHEPRSFSTWGAKAVALIGKLPTTLMARSIEIRMNRKLTGEKVKKVRPADHHVLTDLARRCARWVADNAEAIRTAAPSIPDDLGDRAQDNWEPLLAIADLAGGDWPKVARAAALGLSGGKGIESAGLGERLLADIRTVLKQDKYKDADRISTEDLVQDLIALEEGSWAEYSRGRPLTKAKLSKLLGGFDVKSKTIRFEDRSPPTAKGYMLDQFTDAFERYPLTDEPTGDQADDPSSPGDPPLKTSHRHNVGGARVSEDFGNVIEGGCDVSENARKPSCDAGCDGVTFSHPPTEGEKEGDPAADDTGRGWKTATPEGLYHLARGRARWYPKHPVRPLRQHIQTSKDPTTAQTYL